MGVRTASTITASRIDQVPLVRAANPAGPAVEPDPLVLGRTSPACTDVALPLTLIECFVDTASYATRGGWQYPGFSYTLVIYDDG
jgi:hypothetical protein